MEVDLTTFNWDYGYCKWTQTPLTGSIVNGSRSDNLHLRIWLVGMDLTTSNWSMEVDTTISNSWEYG